MKGRLQKTGKRTKRRVTRFFQLSGNVLSSHHNESSPATWSVDIGEAIITGSDATLELKVELPDVKTITLYSDSLKCHKQWMFALESAVARKFESFYEDSVVLGEGSFSTVKLATSRINRQQLVAAKHVDKHLAGSRFGVNELKALRTISHPNVIQTIDVFESMSDFTIVTELADRGTLFDYLAKISPSELEVSTYVRQILEALKHLHENGVIHRNLKPENVLLCGGGTPAVAAAPGGAAADDGDRVVASCAGGAANKLTVKLSDHGFANWYRVGNDSLNPTVVPIGEAAYVAPDVMAQRDFTPKMDLWSAGVLTFEMMTGHKPQLSAEGAVDIDGCAELKAVSASGVALLRLLLNPNDRMRITAAVALRHPWISQPSSLSGQPIGNSLAALGKRAAPRKLALARRDGPEADGYTTAGSFQRQIPDTLTYGARSVANPQAYSINRDPWGGKAQHQQGQFSTLRTSRSLQRAERRSLGGSFPESRSAHLRASDLGRASSGGADRRSDANAARMSTLRRPFGGRQRL